MSSPSRACPGLVWLLGSSLLAALIVGQGCPTTPPGDSTSPDTTPTGDGVGQTVGPVVAVRAPSINQSMAPGDSITLVYDATGSNLAINAFYDHDGTAGTGDEVAFATSISSGTNRFIQLPTTQLAPGVYHLGITATNSVGSSTVYAAGSVTLVGSMVFTEPFANVTVGSGVQVPLRFNAGVGVSSFNYRTFYDTDGVYSGNETTIASGSSTAATVEGVFDTTGLSAGTYYVGAHVSVAGGGGSTTYAPGLVQIVSGAFVQILQPTLGVAVSPGTIVHVVFSASDPVNSSSTVRVFYDPDTDRSNGNDVTIATLPVSQSQANWDTSNVQPGTYYVGAELLNGFTTTLMSYSAGPVNIVTPGGTGQPGTGTPGTTNLTLTTPLNATTVFEGKVFRVNWTTNLRPGEGTVSVYRTPLDKDGQAQTSRTKGIGAEGIDASTQYVDFDTTGAVGQFQISAVLTKADKTTLTVKAAGVLTVRPLIFWVGDLATKRTGTGAAIPQTGAFQGAVFRGFNFQDNLGSAMISVPDYDGDNHNEILLVAQFAKPLLFAQQGRGAGEAYMIYGQTKRYAGDYDVNTTGSENLPGTIFSGIFPNPFGGAEVANGYYAKAGTSDPYTVDGQLTAPFDTEGLRSVTVIPDQDDDGNPELAFGVPWCNSFGLWNQLQLGLVQAPMTGYGRLENNGQFLRGGVVIVSSRNSLLAKRTALSRHLDRVMQLQEVGQMFVDMSTDWMGWSTNRYGAEDCCASANSGAPALDSMAVPWEGFLQETDAPHTFGVPRVDPPRLADPIPARGYMISYGDAIAIDQIDSPVDAATALTIGGRAWNDTCPSKFNPKIEPFGDDPGFGQAFVLLSGFYYDSRYFNFQTFCPHVQTRYSWCDAVRQLSAPMEPLGCRILGQTTTQPRMGTTANRFGNSIACSGDFLMVGAPTRTVVRGDVLTMPEASRDQCGEIYMMSLKRPGNRRDAFPWAVPTTQPTWGGTDETYDTTMPPPHKDLPAPYNYVIKDLGYVECNADVVVNGPKWEVMNPFHIVGASPGDKIGEVTALHDINNDTVEDFAVGGTGTNNGRGAVYVIYRRQPESEGNYLLEHLQVSLTDPERVNGLMIVGENNDNIGGAVAGGGPLNDDYNNDSYADLLIGSPNAQTASGFRAGEVFVLFGGKNLLNPLGGSTISELRAAGHGMLLIGEHPGDGAGTTVANAGDINGDGLPDILISAPNASPWYWNRSDPNNPIEQIGLDLNGDNIADDLDLDGYPDDMTGAGLVYVVFGGKHLTGTINLNQIGTVNLPGFRIVGRKAGDHIGGGLTQANLQARGVTAAGDIDADGRADLLLGSILADPDGRTNAGEVYLIYGFRP